MKTRDIRVNKELIWIGDDVEIIKLDNVSTQKISSKQRFSNELVTLVKQSFVGRSAKQLVVDYPILQGFFDTNKIINTEKLLSTEGKIQLLFDLAFRAQTILFNKQSRADNGVYYTPSNEVRPLMKKLASSQIKSLCEPACGTSILTLTFLDEYIIRHKDVPTVRCFDLSDEAASLSGLFIDLLISIRLGNKVLRDSNRKIICADISSNPFSEEEFELILMNPPYVKGAKKFLRAHNNDLTKFGTSNLTNVFMSYAFSRTSEFGKGLYILGEPVKWGNSYNKIVNQIYSNYKISDYLHSLSGFDSIQYEIFAIVIERVSKLQNKSNIIGRYASTLVLNLTKNDETIVKRMLENSRPLVEFTAQCTRGIYVKKDRIHSGTNFISSGKEMNAYQSQTNYGIDKFKDGWKEIFDQRRLIVKAKRGKLLHATVAEPGIATTDNVVNIAPKELPLFTFLAFLNSAPVSFFLTEVIFCGNSESARILDGIYLQKLIFPKLNTIELKKLEKLGKFIYLEVLKSADAGFDNWHLELGRDARKIDSTITNLPINEALKEIDEILFKAFGIKPKEAATIMGRYGRVLTSQKKIQKPPLNETKIIPYTTYCI